mgnify:FL=1
MYESLIAQKLRKNEKDDLYFWFDKNEVDFVTKGVAYNVVSSKNIPERELKGLIDIKKKKKYVNKLVLLNEMIEGKKDVEYIKIKNFLLN